MIHEAWMICRFLNLGLWVIYEWSMNDMCRFKLWMICKVVDCRFNWWINQDQELQLAILGAIF
jgi:hypothetical protein